MEPFSHTECSQNHVCIQGCGALYEHTDVYVSTEKHVHHQQPCPEPHATSEPLGTTHARGALRRAATLPRTNHRPGTDSGKCVSSGLWASRLLGTLPFLREIEAFEKLGPRSLLPTPTEVGQSRDRGPCPSSASPSSTSSVPSSLNPSVASSVGAARAHLFPPTITGPGWPCSPQLWKLGVQGLWGNCWVSACVCPGLYVLGSMYVSVS